VPSAHPLDHAGGDVLFTDVLGPGLRVGGVEVGPAIEGSTDEREADTSGMASETLAIVSDRGRSGAT